MNIFIENKPGTGSTMLVWGVIIKALADLRDDRYQKTKILVLEFDSTFRPLADMTLGANYVQVTSEKQCKSNADIEVHDLEKLTAFPNDKDEYLRNFIAEFDHDKYLLFLSDAWKFPVFFIDWLTSTAKSNGSVLGVSTLSKNDCNGVFSQNWVELHTPLRYRIATNQK